MIPNKPDHIFVYWATLYNAGELLELELKFILTKMDLLKWVGRRSIQCRGAILPRTCKAAAGGFLAHRRAGGEGVGARRRGRWQRRRSTPAWGSWAASPSSAPPASFVPRAACRRTLLEGLYG